MGMKSKRHDKNKPFKAALGIVLFAVLAWFILLIALYSEDKKVKNSETKYESVNLIGEYSLDGKEWNELDDNFVLKANQHYSLKFRGHFDRDIPKNQQLIFRLGNLRFWMKVNGVWVITKRQESDKSSISDSEGNFWYIYRSEGITTQDDVEITLENVYINYQPRAFADYFERIYVGSAEGILHNEISQGMIRMLMGFVL